MPKPEDIAILRSASRFGVRAVGYLAGVFVVVDVGDVVKLKCWCRGRNQSSKQRQHTA